MPRQLELEILPQPDDATCGPTCLQAVYRYFGDDMPLEQVIRETPALGGGIGQQPTVHSQAPRTRDGRPPHCIGRFGRPFCYNG